MKKKEATGNTSQPSQEESGEEYGAPIYLTINTSNINRDTTEYTHEVMEYANEQKSTLYLTVNSGQPPQNPPCPPSGCK